MRSHCSQVFTPSLTVNGRLNVSLDQNGVTTVGLHTPTSMLGYSMERVREDTVSDNSQLNRSEWKAFIYHLYLLPVHQKATVEDPSPRPFLQPSPTVTEPPPVQRKRGLSSVSFLSDAMEGKHF